MTVVIAGAGPTGLTAACALRQRGIDVRVVDAAAGPVTTSRAIGLQPRSVGVLRRLGALGDVPSRAISMRGMIFHVEGKEMLSVDVGDLFDRAGVPAPMLVSQAEVESALRERLESLGGAVEWGVGVAAGHADDHGVRIELSSGECCDVDWLIGCDGAHSKVRRIAGATFPGSAAPQRFLLADLHLDLAGDHATARNWLHSDGVFVLFPLPGAPDLYRAIVEVGDANAGLNEAEIVDRIVAAMRARTNLPEVQVSAVEWTSDFRISERLTSRYRNGRVFLAGDAAHIHSPIGGQGMNTGIGDAENLAWKLASVIDGVADDALLDSYEDERRPVAKNVLAATGAATRIGLSRNPITATLRKRLVVPLMPIVGRVDFVQGRVARAVSQMGISYRRGPLGQSSVLRRGLVSGDPVGDVDLVGVDGTLYDNVAGSWVVLAPSVAAADRTVASARNLLGVDAVTVLATADGRLADSQWLIRPDGHLAWQSGGEAIEDWFARVGVFTRAGYAPSRT